MTTGTDASVGLCYDGHGDLPGPLCHSVIAKDGTVHLVGHGRANHAGTGDDDVLRAVIAENYGTTPPRPNENNTDGNARFYGFECVNLGDGKDPWPDAQLEAIERTAAAICRAHGWTAKSVIGHKEWTNTKIDPRGFGMPDLRARVASRLDKRPTGSTQTKGRVGWFFATAEWDGEPYNAEPHKSAGISWHRADQLPDDTVPYNAYGIAHYLKGESFRCTDGRGVTQ